MAASVPDFPRLPPRYAYDAARIERLSAPLRTRRAANAFAAEQHDSAEYGSSRADEGPQDGNLLKVAVAIVLSLHAGDEGFVFAVQAGAAASPGDSGTFMTASVIRGNVDRRNGNIGDLLRQTQHSNINENSGPSNGPRVMLKEGDAQGSRGAPYPLMLSMNTASPDVELEIAYDTLLVPELEARWILEHILDLHDQLLKLDDATLEVTPLSSLRMLSPSDRQVLVQYATSAPTLSYEHYPESITTLHGFFLHTADAHPDAPALQFDDLVLSYSQLLHLAAYLAVKAIIPNLGSKSNPVIPICLDKSPEMIISMLAVLLSGAAYLNLEPAWPDQRKQTILNELKDVGALADVFLVKGNDYGNSRWSGWDQAKEKTVVDPAEIVQELLENLGKLKDNYPFEETSWPPVKAEDLAYVIYTSGTTGVPKGIAVEHRNVSAFLRNYRGVFGRAKGERVLQFPSYSFDVSVMNIWDTFAHGSTLCMTTPSTLMSDLAGTILRLNCTLVDLTPTISSLLFEHLESQPLDGESVLEAWQRAGFKIKQLNTGGEKVEAWIRDAWMDRGVRVVIDYGPTETTVGVIANQSKERSPPSVPIGRPVGATRIHVLSPDTLETLPLGCIGEICVGGAQLTRGYIRSKLNEGVFVDVDGLGRIYRTGDLGRFLGDGKGSIECLGRKDGQVKVNGLRIETGEIEQHLTSKVHRGIRRGVVDKLETDDVAPSLVAFLDLSTDEFPTDADRSNEAQLAVLPCSTSSEFARVVEEAKRYLGGVVPSYMVPRYWLPVNRVPTQGMGKTDRKSLRLLAERHDWRTARKAINSEGSRKRTEDEWHRTMRHTWTKVLQMDEADIGDEDAFTKLGGDSIGFLRVIGKLRQQGFTISFRELVDCATLTQCANALERASTLSSDARTAPRQYTEFSLLPASVKRETVLDEIRAELGILHVDVEDVLPTAPSQDALLAASIDSTHYYAQAIYPLADDIEIDTISLALCNLVRRNVVLRTCFGVLETTGTTMQIVLAAESKQVRQCVKVRTIEADDSEMDAQIDVSDFLDVGLKPLRPAKDGVSAVQEWLATDRAAHVFEWGRLLLSFAVFTSPSSGKKKLAWSMHHAMSDGWTLELLSTDLRCLVHSLELESRPSFSSIVNWWSSTPADLTSIESFWKTYMAGAQPLNWPSQAALKGEQLSTSSAEVLHWSGDLKDLAKRTGITPAIASRVAIALTLGRFAASDEVVLGIVRSGRDIEVLQAEVIGPCVSVLPSRTKLDPRMSLLHLAERETQDDRKARANQQIRLSDLTKVCELSARKDLFDILVTYQSLAERDDDEPEHIKKLSWPIRQPPEKIRMPTAYTLSMEVTPQLGEAQSFELACFYDPRLIESETVKGVLKAVARILDYFVAAPCTKIGDVKLDGGEVLTSKQTREVEEVRGEEEEEEEEVLGDLSETKQRITKAWSTVLNMNLDEIGDSDSFGSLGGDSIAMMRLSVRLTKEDVAIPVQALTKLATVKAQARWFVRNKQEKKQGRAM
ncbi:BZ3500_MvSof-1268-A1-R1_Chr8-2g10288 [Microbotryum saponariae]|uniref:BZ3500_MvSof-1268-A1-R1_Chr8-2g10288 protein n=1 Tax=Microbotryum saponariae TaxID=289078 RepID=A0A2X0KRC6_9BASI|nr:BZ3500_MvSof-1268-A1-R1_Chr8-2g10288 [Microbotryum saponariae]SDA02106.1 BZ3501_MvSof-1269-A2-R1_Chr8-2g10038 [Microbotryum saponariae]